VIETLLFSAIGGVIGYCVAELTRRALCAPSRHELEARRYRKAEASRLRCKHYVRALTGFVQMKVAEAVRENDARWMRRILK